MSHADAVKERDGYACVKCGFEGASDQLQAHHIVPKEYGGADDPANMATLCVHCHRYAPHYLPESASFEAVFSDYRRTGLRPKFDMMYFGIEASWREIDVEMSRKQLNQFIEAFRKFTDVNAMSADFAWGFVAVCAGYGTVGEEMNSDSYQQTLSGSSAPR